MQIRFRYLLIASAVLIVSLLLPSAPIVQTQLRNLDHLIYDTLLSVHYALTKDNSQGVYDNICIVDIDEHSIEELGQFSTWPSVFFADLVSILAEDEPMAIAFDVLFTESDSIRGYARKRLLEEMQDVPGNQQAILDRLSTDASFAQAMEEAGNVYLAMFNSDYKSTTRLFPDKLKAWRIKPKKYLSLEHPHPPIQQFSDAARGIGFAHVEPDESGIIHDFPLFLSFGHVSYVNFSMQLVLDLLGINRMKLDSNCKLMENNKVIRQLPLSPKGRFLLKYYGPQKSFRYIPFSDIIFRRLPPGYLNNRIILVGSSAAGLKDIKITPLDKNYPGVELHATFIRNVLENDYIKWINPWLILALNILLLFFMAIAIPNTRPLLSLSVFLVLSFATIPATYLLFSMHSTIYEFSTALVPWVFGFLALFIGQAHEQGVEKRKVRNAFEHYISKDVISQIMKGSQSLSAGGEKKTISILFIDVRSFSTLCEKLSLGEVTTFMNHYYNLATEVILDNHGLLDKYIGDAILALFGAPVSYQGFELNALKTAITIRNISFALQRENQEHPVLSSFRIGAGIATGEVIVGNIGSDTIFNYTGFGDRMNFSSRLEGLNKVYHTSIIIDEATYQKVSQQYFCRRLDRVKVKGKAIESDIYEVIDNFSELPKDSKLITTYRLYETALALINFNERNEAKNLFEAVLKEIPDDEPTKLMLHRLDTMDWSTWTGAWQYDSK